MNLQRLLLALASLCFSPSLWATTYSYQGPPYTSKIDYTSPCGTGPCANYALGQRITGQFTTAAPLPPNLVSQDVHASVTSYLFTDGVNGYSSSDPNTRYSIFTISTDAAGNIIAASSEVQFQLWQSGSSPHHSGDRLALVDACSGSCGGAGGDNVLNNFDCTSVQVSGGGGNIAPDTCAGGGPDASSSQASVTAGSTGTWAVAAGVDCGGVDYPFPYTDVSSVGAAFCPGIMEAYVTGVSKGTTPTTFSPSNTVTRVQMTTFLQRSLDQGLTRASRRATLNQWWVPQNTNAMQTISVGGAPLFCAADGENIWVPNNGQVIQVQANTGAVLGTWTAAAKSTAVLVAAGSIFVVGESSPGSLYVIDPTQVPGAITVAASNVGNLPIGIAFDGTNLWTANDGGSVSIITPQATTPYPVTTVTAGFTIPRGILYDGTHIWVTDQSAGKLFQLDASGNITQTVTVGAGPRTPGFDGTNIWVPNAVDNSITVVQASTGNVVATITADATNLLNGPLTAAFDGERILVTNFFGNSVTVFKATDLSFIANVTTGASTEPFGACSDGINFWIDLAETGNLLRF